jgi:hypothetical protein
MSIDHSSHVTSHLPTFQQRSQASSERTAPKACCTRSPAGKIPTGNAAGVYEKWLVMVGEYRTKIGNNMWEQLGIATIKNEMLTSNNPLNGWI